MYFLTLKDFKLYSKVYISPTIYNSRNESDKGYFIISIYKNFKLRGQGI